MSAVASHITSPKIVYSIVYSGADQRKHQSSASLAFVRGIHRWPMNSPHKGPVTRKMFPFDDVIMKCPHVDGITFRRLLYWVLSTWQLLMGLLTRIPSIWRPFLSERYLVVDLGIQGLMNFYVYMHIYIYINGCSPIKMGVHRHTHVRFSSGTKQTSYAHSGNNCH